MFFKVVAAYCVFFLSGIAIVQGVLPECQLLEATLTEESNNLANSETEIITTMKTTLSFTIDTSIKAATIAQEKIVNTCSTQTNVDISTCIERNTVCMGEVSKTADNPCIAEAMKANQAALQAVKDLGYVIRDNCCGNVTDAVTCAQAQRDLPIVTAQASQDLDSSALVGLQCITVEYAPTVERGAQQCTSDLLGCASQTCVL